MFRNRIEERSLNNVCNVLIQHTKSMNVVCMYNNNNNYENLYGAITQP